MNTDARQLTYKIALSMLEGITAEIIAHIEDCGVDLDEFFESDKMTLASKLGSTLAFDDMKRQEALFRARKEREFVERHNIRVLFVGDENYPLLLREIPDAPVVLYALGSADLSVPRCFSVVGTRRCTSYGLNFTRQFVADMYSYFPDSCVISGLAYGIDASAHEAALQTGLTTVAVVAHGLDMIYPAAHRDLARRIVESGGAIVSEYPSTVRPLQRNFLERNRIIAGLSEFSFVVESEVRGGAMSTANQAFSYSRDVIALPGRFTDTTSSGCNHLIASQKAHIFTTMADLLSLIRWPISAIGRPVKNESRNLFPELEGDAATVLECMRSNKQPMSVDEIHASTRLSMPSLMAVLTELEFDGIIIKLPGLRYEMS